MVSEHKHFSVFTLFRGMIWSTFSSSFFQPLPSWIKDPIHSENCSGFQPWLIVCTSSCCLLRPNLSLWWLILSSHQRKPPSLLVSLLYRLLHFVYFLWEYFNSKVSPLISPSVRLSSSGSSTCLLSASETLHWIEWQFWSSCWPGGLLAHIKGF